MGERRANIDGSRQSYSCDWESRIGNHIAVCLAAFEVKRLIIIIVELLIKWNIIHLVGGFPPVIFSIIDIFLGFFTALGAVYLLPDLGRQLWNSMMERSLKCLLILIIICVIMNIFTLISVNYSVSVKEKTIARVFNDSMHHYIINEYDKSNVDQIQFDLQCCGHSNYFDWFCINWQNAENGDEITEIENWNVPFSCCSIEYPGSCNHTQMITDDIRTINNQGCSSILSIIILRIVFVAHVIGIILIVTQIFLAVCIVRMLIQCFRESSNYASETTQSSLLLSDLYNRENYSGSSKRKVKEKKKIDSIRAERPEYFYRQTKSDNEDDDDDRESLNSSSNFLAAQISPSVHSEHHVPSK